MSTSSAPKNALGKKLTTVTGDAATAKSITAVTTPAARVSTPVVDNRGGGGGGGKRDGVEGWKGGAGGGERERQEEGREGRGGGGQVTLVRFLDHDDQTAVFIIDRLRCYSVWGRACVYATRTV